MNYLLLLYSLIHKECSSKSGLLRNLANIFRRISKDGVARARTCFASTACVNSGENATWVIDTSSKTRLNRSARFVRFSRTSRETCVALFSYLHHGRCKKRVTISRCVISWLALNCATTLFKTSFTIEGSTRSSKSWPSSR